MEQQSLANQPLAEQPLTEQLQNIYDTVPCGILRFRREGERFTLLSMNRAAQNLLGYSGRAEGLEDWHNGIAGTVLVEDWPLLLRANASLMKPGDSVAVTYRARRPEGGVRWLSGYNTLIESNPGFDIIQRTMFDITDRQLLQEQLRQEREMYRMAMESSSDMMYEYRMDEDLFCAYQPVQDGGVRRVEVPHYRLAVESGSFIHPDDVRMVTENLCGGQAELFECRIIPPDEDKYQWFRITGKLLGTPGHSRIVGAMRNIQQEKASKLQDEAFLEMHRSAVQALSSIYMCIFYVDLPKDWYYGVRLPDSRVVAIPRSGRFGEVMSLYFTSHADEEELPRLLPYADPAFLGERLRAAGDRLEVEFCHRRNANSPVWLRLEYQLISTEDGAPKNFICAFRNVTESRILTMAHQEEERKAKRALEEAYQAASDANKAKSDFLNKMSHDMRTPMNAILGMTTVAFQHLGNPSKMEDCLNKIQMSSRHLLNLINEVLDMSKIETGSVSLNESVVDLRRLAAEAAEMIRPDVEKKGHTLTATLELTHNNVLCDSLRLSEVLLNLLSNAVKYTRDGGRIELGIREEARFSDATRRYVFTVKDNGIGMPASFLERIFLPFERAEDSRVSSIQGTGLGMTITQNLVRIMNGTIDIQSAEGKGTTVTVALSLPIAQTPAPTTEPSGAETPGAEPPRSGKPALKPDAHVLLVEDNALNREITQELLGMAGLRAEEAVNGEEAVEFFQKSPVGSCDLILMDIQMPKLDGYAATRAIRAMDRPDAKSVPIIALTANAFAEDVSRAREAGMNEHLSKPIELNALMNALSRWLSR